MPVEADSPPEKDKQFILGTRVCAEAAMRHGVLNFVLVSTDKAVRPTNIRGGTCLCWIWASPLRSLTLPAGW